MRIYFTSGLFKSLLLVSVIALTTTSPATLYAAPPIDDDRLDLDVSDRDPAAGVHRYIYPNTRTTPGTMYIPNPNQLLTNPIDPVAEKNRNVRDYMVKKLQPDPNTPSTLRDRSLIDYLDTQSTPSPNVSQLLSNPSFDYLNNPQPVQGRGTADTVSAIVPVSLPTLPAFIRPNFTFSTIGWHFNYETFNHSGRTINGSSDATDLFPYSREHDFYGNGRVTLSSGRNRGGRALRVDMNGRRGPDGGAEWRSHIAGSGREAVLTYYVWLPEMKGRIKLPGLCNRDCPNLKRRPADPKRGQGFSSPYQVLPDNRLVLELNYQHQPGQYGQMYPLTPKIPANRWVELTQRVRMNDTRASNAELQVWVDRREVLRLTGLQLTEPGGHVDGIHFAAYPTTDGIKDTIYIEDMNLYRRN